MLVKNFGCDETNTVCFINVLTDGKAFVAKAVVIIFSIIASGFNNGVVIAQTGDADNFSSNAQKRLTDATYNSQQQAQQVLSAGIKAHGGLDKLRASDRLTVNYRTRGYALGQNSAFLAPAGKPNERSGRAAIDVRGNRFFYGGRFTSPVGEVYSDGRTVITGENAFRVDLIEKRISRIPVAAQSRLRRNFQLQMPHFLLIGALERAETLRFGGTVKIENKNYQVVSFADETGTPFTLLFDEQTKLLARHEEIGVDAVLGDIVETVVFNDYQNIGGVQLPGKRIVFTGRSVVSETDYTDFQLDFATADSLLSIPAGFAEAAPPTATVNQPTTEAARKLGDGIYVMQQLPNGYNVMFVEFKDYVMILEAPGDAAFTKAALAVVKQTIPNKPVRYVSFSHFHFDHAGGLREYIAAGATIITSKQNKSFVEQTARANFRLRPDSLALQPRAPIIEAFEKKRIFTDGARALELHNIGPNSHVEDMTVVYLPDEKILYQADMIFPLESGELRLVGNGRDLVKKVRELKLDVKTVVSVHGSAIIPWQSVINTFGADVSLERNFAERKRKIRN